MTAHEIVSMGMVMRGQDFAAAVARGATLDDLDSNEFDRFRKLCQAAGDDLGDLWDGDLLRGSDGRWTTARFEIIARTAPHKHKGHDLFRVRDLYACSS